MGIASCVLLAADLGLEVFVVPVADCGAEMDAGVINTHAKQVRTNLRPNADLASSAESEVAEEPSDESKLR